jgi:hypothetical protein
MLDVGRIPVFVRAYSKIERSDCKQLRLNRLAFSSLILALQPFSKFHPRDSPESDRFPREGDAVSQQMYKNWDAPCRIST